MMGYSTKRIGVIFLAKNNKNLTIGVVIALFTIVVTISAAYYQQISSAKNSEKIVREEFTENNTLSYTNGVYNAIGNYISPGGAEKINVTITLQDGIITESEVTPQATHDISIRMQSDFSKNYKPFVIGKSIDEIKLTKVSGSSLTPGGFNNALEKIKTQAQQD